MIQEILRDKYYDCLTGEALTDKGKKIPAGLDIYENKNSLKVPRIVVKEECKGNGVGTQIMDDLIAYADSNTQIVTLTPSSDFGGNKNRLIQFYKRFGFKHNSGVHKNYEFRDTMIRYPKLNENKMNKEKNNKIKGGVADKLSKKDIADKFKIDISELEKELNKGIKVELEHTDSKEMAEEIAMDHLSEMPDYYTRLDKMEKESEKQWKEKLKEQVARELRAFI